MLLITTQLPICIWCGNVIQETQHLEIQTGEHLHLDCADDAVQKALRTRQGTETTMAPQLRLVSGSDSLTPNSEPSDLGEILQLTDAMHSQESRAEGADRFARIPVPEGMKKCPRCPEAVPATEEHFHPSMLKKSGAYCRVHHLSVNNEYRRNKRQVNASSASQTPAKTEADASTEPVIPKRDMIQCPDCPSPLPATEEHFYRSYIERGRGCCRTHQTERERRRAAANAVPDPQSLPAPSPFPVPPAPIVPAPVVQGPLTGRECKRRREDLGLTVRGLAEITEVGFGGIQIFEENNVKLADSAIQILSAALAHMEANGVPEKFKQQLAEAF